MRACCLGLTTGLLALATMAAASFAQEEPPQFVAPPDTLPLEDDCTMEVYRSDLLQVRDSKMDVWILRLVPATTVSVTGQADVDYLRPGLSIQFDNELNKKGQLEQTISEIELLPDRTTLGLFALDDADSRPVRNPEPGAYRIRGKLAAVKQGQLTVSIGGRRYVGELADDVKINFSSDDPNVAEAGDAVKIKAWYYNNAKPISAMNIPGRAFAESISITLEKPLQPTGRRRK